MMSTHPSPLNHLVLIDAYLDFGSLSWSTDSIEGAFRETDHSGGKTGEVLRDTIEWN